MQTPKAILGTVATRGEFRQVIESAKHENRPGGELPPDHPLWDVWAIMADQYGSQWTHGAEPNMGWVYALRDMTAEQLRKGVDNLVHRDNNKWPPNAQEFADLCQTSFTWERACHKVWQPERRLEDLTAKEVNREMGRKFFEDIKW